MVRKRKARISQIDANINKRKKIRISNILLLIFIIIFIYSSYNVFMWLNSDRKLKKLENGLYKDVVKIIDNNEITLPEEEYPEEYEGVGKGSISVDFERLKKINSDVIG